MNPGTDVYGGTVIHDLDASVDRAFARAKFSPGRAKVLQFPEGDRLAQMAEMTPAPPAEPTERPGMFRTIKEALWKLTLCFLVAVAAGYGFILLLRGAAAILRALGATVQSVP
jgi:hypothetical protein